MADLKSKFMDVYVVLKSDLLNDPAFDFTDDSCQWIDRELTLDVQNVIAPPRLKCISTRKEKKSTVGSSTADASSNGDVKPEIGSPTAAKDEPAPENCSPLSAKRDRAHETGSPLSAKHERVHETGSPVAAKAAESPTGAYSETRLSKSQPENAPESPSREFPNPTFLKPLPIMMHHHMLENPRDCYN